MPHPAILAKRGHPCTLCITSYITNVGLGTRLSQNAHTTAVFTVKPTYTKMAADVEIKFCFACGAKEPVTSDGYIFCEECELETEYDGRTEDFLPASSDQIKYCYKCGKEFHRGRRWLICKDGCRLKLPLKAKSGTRSDTTPTETYKGERYDDKYKSEPGCAVFETETATTKIGTSQVESSSQYCHGGKKQFTAAQCTLQLHI